MLSPTGRRVDLVRAAAKEIRAIGRRSLEIPCDVTDEATIKTLLDAACKEFGGVQILVNSAGRTKRTPTVDIPDASGTASSKQISPAHCALAVSSAAT